MKQLKGVVELHGDHVELREGNNEKSAYIEGVSPYDFNAIILSQNETWKKDLIKDLSNDLGIGLYTIKDMVKVWDASVAYLEELDKIKSGVSILKSPISPSKEQYFKKKK